MQAFFMSWVRYGRSLLQISGRSISLCKLFSCPGGDMVGVCYRFSEGVAPRASFSHVPGAIRRGFATGFKHEMNVFVAGRGVWGFLTCKRLVHNLFFSSILWQGGRMWML